MSIRVLLAWSAVSMAALLALDSPKQLGLFLACFLTLAGFASPKIPRGALLWSVPFVLPLGIVHGVLNPQFSVSSHVGLVPIRWDGLVYAILVSSRIFVLTLLAAAWREVDVEGALRFSSRMRVPVSVSVLVAAAISTIGVLEERIRIVYLAQQARGLAVGPGLLARLRAVPAVVLPVVTTTLVEAGHRGILLGSRGLGSSRFPNTGSSEPLTAREALFILCLLMGLWCSLLVSG